MPTTIANAEAIRRSISLPPELSAKIDAIAETRRMSGNRAIVELLADAVAAWEQRRQTFFELADRFQRSTDAKETKRLREELAKLTFGN